ncbi:MAG: putative beta-glucosidase [Candidatus Saccharibacteria bacterium]|nr:putative beta-glucosidase [Candidatus Saccharibacteria bacterium]
MTEVSTNKHQFSKRFLWGASTAAHQVEGGNHNQWTVWELENAKAKAAQASYHYDHYVSWERVKDQAKNPSNYVSDTLADHYNRYEEDFKLLGDMHMNAFRFSVEWSRIEPEEGAWSAEAITHYKQYVRALKKRGIEPVVTLFHFTLPVWFSEMGGFEKRSNVKYFTRFAQKIVSELGLEVRLIITINEPEVYATESYYHQNWPPAVHSYYKWWRVVNNMAYAHRQAAKAIHKLHRHYKVSIAKNSNFIYPGDNAWLSRISAALSQYFQDDYFIKKVVRHCDFLGINYYFSNRFYGDRIHNPDQKLSDLNWDMHPADIQFTLERLHGKYQIPIIITENGLADAEDSYRKWWITETITAMQRAIKNGVQLQGYLHWSLIDNFEWAYGRWPRFGLAAIDYSTGKRTLRPSARWFGRVIKNLRGI